MRAYKINEAFEICKARKRHLKNVLGQLAVHLEVNNGHCIGHKSKIITLLAENIVLVSRSILFIFYHSY
jgi:hypothetical protein